MKQDKWLAIGTINQKIFTLMSMVALLVLALYTGIFFLITKKQLSEDLNKTAEMTVDRLALGLEKPLWDVSEELTISAILPEMNEKQLAGILVKEADGKVFSGARRDAEGKTVESKEPLSGNFISKTKDIKKEDELLGTVEVFFVDDFLMSELKKSIFFIVLAGFSLAVPLLAAVIFSVRTLVTKPLARCVEVIESLSRGNLHQRTQIDTKDELGVLSESIDRFSDALSTIIEQLKTVGQGDLTVHFPNLSEEDEISPVLQKMSASLMGLVRQVKNASLRIATGSTEVSHSSQALSQGATEQAASLEQITSSMTELAEQTKTNAHNASKANQLSSSAGEAADNGNEHMQGMVGAMDDISGSSMEIAKIIKTIDDIAFQTNLLALNAAVEAARAGKHGKGFAVVAQEVRNLASRSAKAAQETAELIERSVSKVENGTEIVNRTAQSLMEIVDTTAKVTDLVGEIAAASNEQAQGFSQINQGLTQIEKVTQHNTASAEETASAAEELSNMAAHLRQLVSAFKLEEYQDDTENQPFVEPVPSPRQLDPPTGDLDSWKGRDLS